MQATSDNELTCKELVELVTAYLENALPDGERARFERHLGYCPGCVEYVEQARRTIQISGRLGEDSLLPTTQDELLSVFRRWKQETKPD